jgi:hypothetical protein
LIAGNAQPQARQSEREAPVRDFDDYVTEELYDECNEDRVLFARYLLSALPYLPTGLKEDVDIALMERLSAADRAEAEAAAIADRP